MALGIAQGTLSHFGTAMQGLMPTEALDYRGSGGLVVETFPFVGRWIEYSQMEKSADPTLLNMRKLRVAYAALTNPEREAVVQNATSQWQIKSIDGGSGHAFWFLHCKQVG